MELTDKKIIDALKKSEQCIEEISKELGIPKDKLKEYLAERDDSCDLFIDGASRGNPGEAGVGIVLSCCNKFKKGYYSYIGKSTNNEAEYHALIRGLKIAHINKVKALKVFTDSELICNQVKGSYKINKEHLSVLNREALSLVSGFTNFSINSIPREKNKEADKLANIAIDKKKDGEIELAVAPHLF